MTGGNAFVSRAIGPALIAAGLQVTACSRPGRPAPAWIAKTGGRATARHVDLAREGGVEDLVEGHDIVIHTAGSLESTTLPAAVFERDNLRATQALIDGALATGCPRIINFSSISVHGTISVPVVDVTTPSVLPTLYGASKLAAEEALGRAAPALSSLSLRLPGIVGPHAHDNWLSRCRAALRAGDPVQITNPDFRFNNVVHAADLAAFVAALCRQDWSGVHAFPVAAGEPMAIQALVERLKAATGSASPVTVVDDDRRPFSISCDYAVRSFGYRPAAVARIIDRFANDP